jgi:hypothetical protein
MPCQGKKWVYDQKDVLIVCNGNREHCKTSFLARSVGNHVFLKEEFTGGESGGGAVFDAHFLENW